MRRRTFFLLYAVGLALILIPYARMAFDARVAYLPPYFGWDESYYTIRLQEGMLGGDTSNGIFSGPNAPPGSQPAGLERLVGMAFGWTGFGGTTVALLVSILLASFVLPIVTLTARRLGASFPVASATGFVYLLLFFHPLHRFVHQSWSLPIALAAFLSIIYWWQERTVVSAVLCGVFLGLLPYVYFWSWTWMWATFGVLCLLGFFQREQPRPRYVHVALIGVLAILLAAPYVFQMQAFLSNPLSREVAERSSMVFDRGFESIPRSIVLLSLAALSLWVMLRRTVPRASWPVFASIVGGTAAFHQQFIHGRVLSFSTHYYPYVAYTALLLLIVLLVQRRRSLMAGAMFLLSLVLVLAAVPAYAFWGGFSRGFPDFKEFNGLYSLQRDGVKETVLTDFETALYVAANSDDDVVFTEHERVLLMPMRELAERYCLSEYVFNPSLGDATLEWMPIMLSEKSRLGRARAAELYAERLAVTKEACAWVSSHPKEALEKYGVTLLLWYKPKRPEARIDPAFFEKVKEAPQGELWRPR